MRATIVKYLVKLGDDAKPAIPALAKAIIDEKGNVSTSAMGLLGTFGADSAVAVPNLIKVLNRSDPSRDYRYVRVKAVSVLGLVGPKARSALPTLERLRGDKWSSMRNRAKLAIRRIRGEGGAKK
jgi:HEAT repeat protein